MSNAVKKIAAMLASYCIVMFAIFLITHHSELSGEKILDAIFISIPLGFFTFWIYAFIPTLVWIKFRNIVALATIATFIACVIWATATLFLESYQVKPGYFGRAIDDGRPTVHYYIDEILNVFATIAVFELMKRMRFIWRRRV